MSAGTRLPPRNTRPPLRPTRRHSPARHHARPSMPSGTPPRLRNVAGKSRENPFLRTPPRRGGVLFYLSNRGDAGRILCRGATSPVPHCARTLSKTPSVCHFPKNRLSAPKSLFAPPLKPGVSKGVFGFFGQKPVISRFAKRQTVYLCPSRRQSRHSSVKVVSQRFAGGFEQKSARMMFQRPSDTAFSALTNYFSEIVAKMTRLVLE